MQSLRLSNLIPSCAYCKFVAGKKRHLLRPLCGLKLTCTCYSTIHSFFCIRENLTISVLDTLVTSLTCSWHDTHSWHYIKGSVQVLYNHFLWGVGAAQNFWYCHNPNSTSTQKLGLTWKWLYTTNLHPPTPPPTSNHHHHKLNVINISAVPDLIVTKL